ncbi:MAG: NUDIX hydrolase [Kofleriaceae bacterium]
MTPQVAVGAFIFDGDRVLAIQRGKPPGEGLWSIPGGRVEPGERIADAIKREIFEETQLVIEVGPLACVIERIGEGYHYVIIDHVARVVSGTLHATDDARDARWVTDAELRALPTTEGLLEALAQARALDFP